MVDICLAWEMAGSVFYGASCNVDEYLPVRNHSLMSAHNLLQLAG